MSTIIISYHSNVGYLGMVHRLQGIVVPWDFKFKEYSRKWLEGTDFYKENKEILDIPKGNGLWSWKPYIILDALKDNDTVIYFDSSVIPTNYDEIQRLINMTVTVSTAHYPEFQKAWTKRDCFRLMDCDTEEYWNASQVWAGIVCAKQEGIPIVNEWLGYCCNKRIISDDPSEDNFPEFREHRHDQSILANLVIKHSLPTIIASAFRDDNNYGL